eukprot:SAG11_NODE_25018_length_363_cov_2.445283_1_plen_106_part_10
MHSAALFFKIPVVPGTFFNKKSITRDFQSVQILNMVPHCVVGTFYQPYFITILRTRSDQHSRFKIQDPKISSFLKLVPFMIGTRSVYPLEVLVPAWTKFRKVPSFN